MPTIIRADRDHLPACIELVTRVFNFQSGETIPAWHIYTSTLYGGHAYCAVVNERVVGFAHAFPVISRDEEGQGLFLTEVAVEESFRSNGIGSALLRAIQAAAIAAGTTWIKFTTNARNSANLYFYLSRIEAQIVNIHRGMYVGLLAGHAPGRLDSDEAEILWKVLPPEEHDLRPRTKDAVRDTGKGEWLAIDDTTALEAEDDDAVQRMMRLISRGYRGTHAVRENGCTLIHFEATTL